MSGIPPTGIAHIMAGTGSVTGIRASNYDEVVEFYTLIFDAADVSADTDEENGNTTWGGLLLVGQDVTTTTNADIFIELSTDQLDAIEAALREGGFGERVSRESNSAKTWLTVPDPNGNTVWIAVAAGSSS